MIFLSSSIYIWLERLWIIDDVGSFGSGIRKSVSSF